MQKIVCALRISFLAVLAGWSAGMVIPFFGALCASLFHPEEQGVLNLGSGIVWLVVIGLYMAAVVLVVWILALFPLTLFAPNHSFLWKPAVLSTIGLFTGPAIVAIAGIVQTYHAVKYNSLQVNNWPVYVLTSSPLAIFAAIIAGVTCLTLALLHSREIAQQKTDPSTSSG
jgi:hypothetical protein